MSFGEETGFVVFIREYNAIEFVQYLLNAAIVFPGKETLVVSANKHTRETEMSYTCLKFRLRTNMLPFRRYTL